MTPLLNNTAADRIQATIERRDFDAFSRLIDRAKPDMFKALCLRHHRETKNVSLPVIPRRVALPYGEPQ